MKTIVVFSGAGMSAESGINTFRDSDGLWEQHRIQDVASPEGWGKNPELVQRFYNQRRKQILETAPNAAHDAIAALEDHFDVIVVTQNIDDLHERSGSTEVIHLHGNIRFAKTSGPNVHKSPDLYPIDGDTLDLKQHRCKDGYPLRPHVVWFGEPVPAYEDAVEVVENADIFIVIGTSLQVYPVAGLIHKIAPDCEAYYVDPKSQEQRLPRQFKKIAKTATEGIPALCRELEEKYLKDSSF